MNLFLQPPGHRLGCVVEHRDYEAAHIIATAVVSWNNWAGYPAWWAKSLNVARVVVFVPVESEGIG